MIDEVNMEITKEMKVAEVFERYSQTRPVFQAFGFQGLMNPALRNTIGRLTSVQDACKHHGVDLDRFLQALNESIQGDEKMSSVIAIHDEDTVNEIIGRYPATIEVFHKYGLDSCCGGAHAIKKAALAHGIDIVQLKKDLLNRIKSAAA